MRPALGILAAAMLAQPAVAADLSRLAPVQALNADLLSRDSATGVLQTRCPQPIRARQVRGAAPPAPRAELGVGPREPVRYRQVELLCGEVVFSHAQNWYLPGRLSPAMNTALDTTQTPFGVVVKPLAFHRRTLSARVLEVHPAGRPVDVLQHRAVLVTPDGRPFSLVVETYTDRALRP